MTIHLDPLTFAMAGVILAVGIALTVGLVWTIRSTSLPANPLRHADPSRLSGSARAHATTSGDDLESEAS